MGIAIGPSGFDVVPSGILSASGFVTDVVLGLIAFGIGQNFRVQKLEEIGRQITRISSAEVICAFLLVTAALHLLLGMPAHAAIVFGALSSATAPAATVAVIQELKAKGPLTDALLGVVALDDAWALILFPVSMAVADAIAMGGGAGLQILTEVGTAAGEIGASVLLGGALAWLLRHYSKRVEDSSDLEILALGIILLTVGAANSLGLEVILACLALGVVLVNLGSEECPLFEVVEPLDTPLYLIFFVLAGALLEVAQIQEIGLLGLVYISARVGGKILGAYIGASDFGRADPGVERYIGLGLIPQAGVALGLALTAREQFPVWGDTIFSTVVATTVLFELVGPLATRTALGFASEIPEKASGQEKTPST